MSKTQFWSGPTFNPTMPQTRSVTGVLPDRPLKVLWGFTSDADASGQKVRRHFIFAGVFIHVPPKREVFVQNNREKRRLNGEEACMRISVYFTIKALPHPTGPVFAGSTPAIAAKSVNVWRNSDLPLAGMLIPTSDGYLSFTSELGKGRSLKSSSSWHNGSKKEMLTQIHTNQQITSKHNLDTGQHSNYPTGCYWFIFGYFSSK